jgi:hypothetical protein
MAAVRVVLQALRHLMTEASRIQSSETTEKALPRPGVFALTFVYPKHMSSSHTLIAHVIGTQEAAWAPRRNSSLRRLLLFQQCFNRGEVPAVRDSSKRS